jgi:phosphonate transport system permease protein
MKSDPSMNSPLSMPKPEPVCSWTTLLLLMSLLALVIASFATLPLKWGEFFTLDAGRTALEFIRGFAPPETSSAFLSKTFSASLETFAMSAVGTLIAAVLGLLIALPAGGRFGEPLRAMTRLILNVLRSIPELVWAAIVLIAAGLGPFGGTLALAVHTTGVLGRLFADSLENVPPHPEKTLRINGSPAAAAFMYATLPQLIPQIVSYTLYRWENNIRAAAVLGVVGAGGLGQMLKYHLSLFHMQQAATVIIAMLLLVALVDGMSYVLRRWLMR